MDSIYAASRRQWEELLTLAPPPSLVPRLLFLDDRAAQVVKSSIGIECLVDTFGFCRILSLDDQVSSPMQLPSSLLPPAPRIAVFIATSSLLTESHPCILQSIISLSSASTDASITIDQITILSSYSEHAHACLEHSSSTLGVEAYTDYSELLHEDLHKTMSSLPTTPRITLKHFPLVACPILPWAFLIPQARDTHKLPSPTPSGRALTGGGGGAGGATGDGEGSREVASLLAHSLGSLVIQLGATSLETYHLSPPGAKAGPTLAAQLVAEELSSLPLPFPVSPPSPSPLTLILVDRALDLASPCSKGGALLPYSSSLTPPPNSTSDASQPLPHPLDIAVASSPPLLPSSSSSGATSESHQAVPSLFDEHPLTCPNLDPTSPAYASWIQRTDQILSRRPRDVLPLVRKWLKEALRQEGISPSQKSKAGSVTPDEIKGLITDLLTVMPSAPTLEPSNTGSNDEARGGSRVPSLAAYFRHSSLLSLSLKLADASSSSSSPSSSSPPPLVQRWIAAATLERQALTLMIQSGDINGLHAMLLDAFEQAKGSKGPLLVTDIIQILPLVYSLWPDACPPDDEEDDAKNGPFTLQQETELVRSVAHSIVAHLAVMLSKDSNHKDQGGAARASEHLDFIPDPILASLLEMGRAGKEGKVAASKDIQRLLRAFLIKLKSSASLRKSLADDDLRCLTFHSSRPRDMFSDPPPLTLDPLLVTLMAKVSKGLPISDLHHLSAEDEGLVKVGARGGVDLRGGVGGALMAGTGYLAKGIAGTLGAILSSSSSSSHQQQQHGQGDEGLHMGARGRVLLAGGSSSRVLIFVVGGISMQELRRASIERIALQQQATDDQGEGGVQRVWIGGTSLIASPLEACRF